MKTSIRLNNNVPLARLLAWLLRLNPLYDAAEQMGRLATNVLPQV